MPTAKELTIRIEDRPGTLGKACRALADHGVNIVAFQSVRSEGKGLCVSWWTTQRGPRRPLTTRD